MTKTYKVSGMTCGHCKANVEKFSKMVPGVTKAEVDLAEGKLTIEGEPDENALKAQLSKLGYLVSASA